MIPDEGNHSDSGLMPLQGGASGIEKLSHGGASASPGRWSDQDYIHAIYTFLDSLQVVTTKRTYTAALKRLFQFTQVLPHLLTPKHISQFFKHLKEQDKLEDSTIANYRAAGRSFYRWLMIPLDIATGEAMARANPFDLIPRPKVNPYEHSCPLALEDFKTILATCNGQDLLSLRDKAILLGYYHTGRRRKEWATLIKDNLVKENERWFIQARGKGQEHERQEIAPEAMEALVAYWVASGRTITGRSPLFTAAALRRSQDGEELGLTDSAVAKMLKRRAKLAGLNTSKVRLHGIRDLAGEVDYQIGRDVRRTQLFLRHKNLNTTAIYLKAKDVNPALDSDKKQKLLED